MATKVVIQVFIMGVVVVVIIIHVDIALQDVGNLYLYLIRFKMKNFLLIKVIFLTFLLLSGCSSNRPVIEEPILKPIPPQDLIIQVLGQGVVSYENFPNPAQAMLMGKRAAIIDGYRQIGERVYGIRVYGKETVKDMIAKDSTTRTCVDSMIKNAKIENVICKDNVCQANMEVNLNGIVFQSLFPWKD